MTSKREMWITYNGGAEKIRFPVLPDKIDIKYGNASQSVNVQGLGEIVIKQDPSAMIISFASFFPVAPFPGVQFENLTPPSELEEKITAWQNGEQPIQFLITGTSINAFFVIETFDCSENGGDVGTLHYSIRLKEYRETFARSVGVNSGGQAFVPPEKQPRIDNRTPQKTYTVVKGDSLWGISRRVLGDGGRYPEIAQLNSDKIQNPNLILEGWVLKMP